MLIAPTRSEDASISEPSRMHAEITGAVFLPLALGMSGRTRPNYGCIVLWDGPAGVYCYANYASPIVKPMKLDEGGVNQACRPVL